MQLGRIGVGIAEFGDALIELESAGAPAEYRLGLRNFFVLTRYNRSVLYASAVYDLAQELRRGR